MTLRTSYIFVCLVVYFADFLFLPKITHLKKVTYVVKSSYVPTNHFENQLRHSPHMEKVQQWVLPRQKWVVCVCALERTHLRTKGSHMPTNHLEDRLRHPHVWQRCSSGRGRGRSRCGTRRGKLSVALFTLLACANRTGRRGRSCIKHITVTRCDVSRAIGTFNGRHPVHMH